MRSKIMTIWILRMIGTLVANDHTDLTKSACNLEGRKPEHVASSLRSQSQTFPSKPTAQIYSQKNKIQPTLQKLAAVEMAT